MADASGAALSTLQSQNSLQYGDHQVTKDWNYYISPVNGAYGESALMVFNPTDPTQRFFLDNPAQHEQLHNFGLKAVQGTDIGQYYADPTGQYNTDYFANLFSNPSLSDLEQLQQQQQMVSQYQSGQMTQQQLNSALPNITTAEDFGVPNVYQQAYDATINANKEASKTQATSSQATQGLQFPSFDEALLQEYKNRPDLQALYNPDGSAKNPNDPRIGGIPTLQEWAMKYGVNESQLLKTAQSNQAGRNAPSLTPISLNPSNQVSSGTLNGGKTMSDVQSLVEANSKKYGDVRDQILKMMQPGAVEMQLEKRLNDIDTLSRNINLSAQAGINKIKNQPVAMDFIVGQAKSVMEDANLQLQTLASEEANVIDRLGLAQKARQTSLSILEAMYNFDREDDALKREDDKLARAEQEASKEFALQYGITAPFYQIGSTVYNTSTGKAYSTPEEFFKAGGARDWSNIQKVEVQADELEGAPTSYKEYMYAVKDGFQGSYNDYQDMDANRKRSVSTSTTINNTNKTEDRVRQIVQMNPNNWANAAAQIDKEFGAGTATLYDSYLREAYKPKRD